MESILGLIQCGIGIGEITQRMDGLLEAMKDFPPGILGNTMSWAKAIGCCIALGVGANECYQMMLGRRGMDVMKILHILIISICITWSGEIAKAAAAPGKILEATARGSANAQYQQVCDNEALVAQMQQEYKDKLNDYINKLKANQEASPSSSSSEGGMIDQVKNAIVSSIDEFMELTKARLEAMAISAEMKICEWISTIIRLIGEILFQVAYYGLMLTMIIYMETLKAFAPIMFALSLSPHYKSAWSQWLSKYISVSFWGFLAWVCMFYVNGIMNYTLNLDVQAYTKLIGDIGADGQMAAIGMHSLGTTCFYIRDIQPKRLKSVRVAP